MQLWLVELKSESDGTGVKYLYLCSADGRETAKRMAYRSLLGDPDSYVVTPLTNPGDVVRMRVNIEMALSQ